VNKKLVVTLLGFAAVLMTGSATANAAPIESVPPAPSLPAATGGPVKAQKVKGATKGPQNPFLAKDPHSNIHNDSWMSDTYGIAGPLGRNLRPNSGAGPLAVCGTITFDSQGRIVTVCVSRFTPPEARLVDPDTLEIISSYVLPQAPDLAGSEPYQNFSGGGYFYLDNRDRVVVATKTDHIYVLSIDPVTSEFKLDRDYDLTSVLDPDEQRISSALPDFAGRIWFVSKQSGIVGTLDRKTGKIRSMEIGEPVQNSFAVARDGVYIATSKRMYRFGATAKGQPRVVWQKKYRNSGIHKPGQADAGTGTTPTILKGGYVAITDNADPMNVVVYRTGKKLRGKKRVVCEVPVFRKGASATENSLMGTGRSLVVENNYGYTSPFAPGGGEVVTEPGFSRVDIRRDGKGCKKIWTTYSESAPSVVPKLSTKTGLIYTYTRPADPSGAQGYYWTAINYKNGKTAWSRLAGTGAQFNNNYAGLALGKNGSAYLGVIGGIVSLRGR